MDVAAVIAWLVDGARSAATRSRFTVLPTKPDPALRAIWTLGRPAR
jgi:hypothetical protein